MLVLSRKTGESIQIDENIFVTVSEVKGGRVRLSIEAPRSVRILRKEIVDREYGAAKVSYSVDLSASKPAECLS